MHVKGSPTSDVSPPRTPHTCEALTAVVRVRFLKSGVGGSPTSVLPGAWPDQQKYVSIAKVPAVCITLVECSLQQARQHSTILLADDPQAFLFTTHRGQEPNLQRLAADLRERLDQVRPPGVAFLRGYSGMSRDGGF